MRIVRKCLTAGFFAVAVYLLTACSPESATTIRVINQSRWAANVERAVGAWNQAHPNRKVILDQLVIGYPQLRAKLITAVGGGKVPDLAIVDSVWLAEFARSGHLAALDEIDPEWVEKEYKGDFFSVFHRGEFFDGHLWGVRTQTDMAILWYRRDWFKSEGLKAPQTWDELVGVGQHFADQEVRSRFQLGRYPLAMPLGTKARETLVYQLLPFFWANGGGVLEKGQVHLNRPENLETLNFLRQLVLEHHLVSPEAPRFEWDRAMKLFASGRVAMAVGGTYEKRLIQEASGWDEKMFQKRVGYALIPAGPRGSPSTTAGGMSYVVFKNAPHKGLACEILKIALSPENMREFCLNTNQHSPRRSVADALVAEKHPFLAATSTYLYEAHTRPVFSRYAQMSDVLQELVEGAVSGEASPQEALGNAEKRIIELVEQ